MALLSAQTVNKNNLDTNCNVYIANLPCDYGKDRLYKLFSPFGEITRHKFVSSNQKSQPGYGFVQFADRKYAENAIKTLQNYRFPTGEVIYLSFASHRRSSLSDEPTNLYIQNIPNSWSNDILSKVFSEYGTIRQCKVVGDGVAFVRFNDHNEALNAIDRLNGLRVNGISNKSLLVRFATRKIAATAYQSQQIPNASEGNKHNLYVRNLPKYYTQKDLENLFNSFGIISTAKINNEKRCAFVRFSYSKDALFAINQLNGTKPKGFDEEIVVKLAHFDIGDSRNRWNKKTVKSSTTDNKSSTVNTPINNTAINKTAINNVQINNTPINNTAVNTAVNVPITAPITTPLSTTITAPLSTTINTPINLPFTPLISTPLINVPPQIQYIAIPNAINPINPMYQYPIQPIAYPLNNNAYFIPSNLNPLSGSLPSQQPSNTNNNVTTNNVTRNNVNAAFNSNSTQQQ